MRGRRRRPLLRTAMVGGAAYLGGKHVAQGQQRESEQEQRLGDLEAQQAPAPPSAPAPAPAPAAANDTVASLERLKGLLDQGVLTPDEFTAAKQKVLAGG
jgi:putative oligomerization/nucleic acid binding protein